MREPVIVGWSGGKDSTLALERLLADPAVEVAGLLTTVTGEYDRVSIHGVRRVLLAQQAAALGLPLMEAVLPPGPSNAIYEAVFAQALRQWQARVPGLRAIAFGDLFLADIRTYRERQLEELGMRAIFPLWGEPTEALARDLVGRGYCPIVVCIDPSKVSDSLAGAAYDDGFLDALPAGIDPCGENGEFHTFVIDGPIFQRPIAVRPGEIVHREGSVFADLLPAS
jgi:uncharacterized protein (TIGR00290 family)